MARVTSPRVPCPVCGAGPGARCRGSLTGASRGRGVDYHTARRERAAVHNPDGLRRFAQSAIDHRLKYHEPNAIVAIEQEPEGVRITLNSGGNFLEIQAALDGLGVRYDDDGLGLFIRRPEPAA